MKTSIVILTSNKLGYTQQCIESIRKYTEPNSYELIVVDDHSKDGTVEWLKEQDDIITLFSEQNATFPRGYNQGIKIALGENILLLNNDTVVTVNWLDNLLKCLYSSADIGLVGPVTNSCSYYQAIRTDYRDLGEMNEFASKYNCSNPLLWEERLKLVGFCVLIKREVIKQIALFDETFSLADFGDDDYSYRARKAGFRLMLCKDTFIHRFGSISSKTNNEYAKLIADNTMKFKQKWGFDASYSSVIRNEIIELMDTPKDNFINVLDIGCACGGTLLKIKHQYKNVELYGIELNENAAEIASQFATVISENIETSELRYPEVFFDYIIFADVLEHLNDPWKILQKLSKYLKLDGKILASIPNVMHYTVLKDLINGKWNYEDSGILDKTHLRFFTMSTANQMFLDAGYINIKVNILPKADEEDHKFVEELCRLSDSEQITQFLAYQYLFKAYKATNQPKKILDDPILTKPSEDYRRNISSGTKTKGVDVDYAYAKQMVVLSQERKVQPSLSVNVKRDARFIYLTSGAPEPFLNIDTSIIEAFNCLNLDFKIFNLRQFSSDVNEFISLINNYNPDFILTVFGQLIPADYLKVLTSINKLTVLWTLDDPHNLELAQHYVPLFDLVFTNDLSCLPIFKYLGTKDVHVLSGGADINKYRPLVLEDKQYSSDILLIGSSFEKRVHYMKRIIDEFGDRAKILIVGPGWGQKLGKVYSSKVVISETWLSPEETAKYYSNTKVNLNIHRASDDTYLVRNVGNVPVWGPNPRTFEIAACKSFQLIDALEDLGNSFRIGEEIITFNSLDNLVSRLHYYLAEDEEREQIATAAYKKVLGQHTIDHRIQKMIEILSAKLFLKEVNNPKQILMKEPKVSIVIPVYNNVELTKQCLESVFKYTTELDYEVIVIDNGSIDNTENFLSSLQDQIIIISNDTNLGFAKACNQGANLAKGKYLLFLNNDTVLTKEWLIRMLEPIENDNSIGIVGCKLLYPNNSIQHAGIGFTDIHGNYEPVHVYQGYSRYSENVMFSKEVQAVTGACLLIKHNLYFDVEMMDEGYVNGLEDIDLCLKVRTKGYKVFYESAAEVYHLESQSVGRFKYVYENINLFLIKWSQLGLIKIDTEEINGKFSWMNNNTGVFKYGTNVNNLILIEERVSIIVLTLNNLDYTKLCIESIINNTHGQYELIIVDNGSTDGTKEYFEGIQQDYPNLRLIFNDKNEGYAYACNQGAALGTGEYLVFLNNDVIVPPNWLSALLSTFAPDLRIGIVGPCTNNCAGPQKVEGIEYKLENYLAYAENWQRKNKGRVTETSMVIGFCMAVRKGVLDIIGGFDSEYGIGNFEDNDFCLRARIIGFKIAIRHDVLIHHFGSRTFINEKIDYEALMEKNKLIFDTKWQSFNDKISEDEKLTCIYVPLDYNVMFNREVPPIKINMQNSKSILAIPDWDDQATWYSLIDKFLQLLKIEPEICMVLRVDPPADEEFQSVLEHLEIFMRDLGIQDIPNIILEGTHLSPFQRGGLYTACEYFVDLPQQRGFLYRRAAVACGCKIITLDNIEKVFAG